LIYLQHGHFFVLILSHLSDDDVHARPVHDGHEFAANHDWRTAVKGADHGESLSKAFFLHLLADVADQDRVVPRGEHLVLAHGHAPDLGVSELLAVHLEIRLKSANLWAENVQLVLESYTFTTPALSAAYKRSFEQARALTSVGFSDKLS